MLPEPEMPSKVVHMVPTGEGYNEPPASLSQKSSYSELPDDISELIALAPSFKPEVVDEDEPPALSQQSSYSELPDICDLILQAPIGTQLTKSLTNYVAPRLHSGTGSGVSEPPPSSKSSSSSMPFSRSTSKDSSVSATISSNGNSTSSSSLFSLTDSHKSTDSSVSVQAETPLPKSILGKRKSRDLTDSPSTVEPAKPFKSAKLWADEEEFPPVIISHSPPHQRLFQALGLPYGVRYEIARISATFDAGYEALDKTELEKLRGLNNCKAIPKIPALFGQVGDSVIDAAFAKEIAAKTPWVELDLEDENLAQNPLSGLGLSLSAADWFGGKIHFTAKLNPDPKNKDTPFKIVLKTPELGPSDRFARRWGSDRFLTLSVSRDALKQGDALIKFLYRPFVLGDHVFRAFDAKDGNVFLFCTNEMIEGRRIHPTRTVPGFPSLREFLAWHNSLELDLKQTMAKWASRFALGRSNSAPVLRLEEDAIIHIPDITSESGSDMTDGAGLINKAGLRLIYNRVEMDTWPTAIQVRVVGAKGLLVMHPTDTQETPRIWLRPSQVKVKHIGHGDPTLRTIDLLRSSHAKTQCRLPVETIINLAENGVSSKAFIKLIEEALVNMVTPLVTWEGPNAMEKLWYMVGRSGGVMSARLARRETVLARVKGYSERDSGEIENDDEEQASDQPVSTAWWVDQISGCPSSLEETVMSLLDAGFHPQTCSVLRAKLEKIVTGCVNRCIESYRIDLPVGMSAMAFLVPDELGVLEEGELFFKTSRYDLQTRDGLPTDILLGPALITRHPCKLPTDVQKWTAVDRPELRHFTDVIVLSVKGPRRAADYLSGGDYDGDKGLVIWQPELVDPFRNAPLSFSEEPPEVAECFSPKNETVVDFLQRTGSMTDAEQLREMQSYLLSAIRDMAVVGKYSNWHMNAAYTLGYQHKETIRLAYMFCKTLDGAKTGLTVLPKVFSKDQRTYDKRPPAWKEAEKKKKGQNADQSNMHNIVRNTSLPTFIMDKLHRHADRAMWGTNWGKELKKEIDHKFLNVPHVVDADLTEPWLTFVQRETVKKEADDRRRAELAVLATHALKAPELSTATKEIAMRWLEEAQATPESDVDRIRNHVEAIFDKHKSKIDGKFSKLPIERRQDVLRELSRDFATDPSGLSMSKEEAARIKASYAYWSDSDKRLYWGVKWSRFPWDVAFRELCLIKTQATGTFKPVNSEFYERFTMKGNRL
ncbi:RNA dependent RNA polymerase-domain-containing protein [Mycena alexandri]|uniref:RNA-dependent RNA polymerase n=1 Tax=Mycena alexandri TaxID=1745969 RepID=A0AAD6TKL0_9AGAR|nr:RNA dependent RNA polymerase-domain-containing protein [Mycena alexandri]